MKLLGYEVIIEKIDDKGMPLWALKGPRGAYYVMARCRNNPHTMFPVNGRFLSCVSVKGHSWFTDKNGELEVWD